MRMRYGFERIQVPLWPEGWRDNRRRTYLIYQEEGLSLRSKRSRRSKTVAHRQEQPELTGPHQSPNSGTYNNTVIVTLEELKPLKMKVVLPCKHDLQEMKA